MSLLQIQPRCAKCDVDSPVVNALVVTGGENLQYRPELALTEVYNPATETGSSGGNLITPRRLHRAVLLEDGGVLVTGGYRTRTGALSECELGTP